MTGPHSEDSGKQPATPEAALAELRKTTGLRLRLIDSKDSNRVIGSELGAPSEEELQVLTYVSWHYNDKEHQRSLRDEYSGYEILNKLPGVLDDLDQISKLPATQDLFYYAMKDLNPTLYGRKDGALLLTPVGPEHAAERFGRFCREVLTKVESFLSSRREAIKNDLISTGPQVDHTLRRLIALLLTVRTGRGSGTVHQTVLFKKPISSFPDPVPPFSDAHWEGDGMPAVEEMVRLRALDKLRSQSFLSYREVAYILLAAGLDSSLATGRTIREFGDEARRRVKRQWDEFRKGLLSANTDLR